MRLIFMGTPDFAVPALEALAGCHEVACVYNRPPKPGGSQVGSAPPRSGAQMWRNTPPKRSSGVLSRSRFVHDFTSALVWLPGTASSTPPAAPAAGLG